jgi:CRISPR-associated protein Csy1
VLSEQLKQGDLTTFEEFSQNDKQLEQWRNGFLSVFKEKDLATHYLAKQTYFPINRDIYEDDNNYHLLNPMMSSSLDQAIFDKINFSKYSKEMVEIRKKKRDREYHQDILVAYPNIAILKVTASNDGNASPLNGKRSGKRYLLPSMPPLRKKIFNPPIKQNSLFSGEFEKRAWRSSKELQKYLVKLQNKKFGNKVIRDQIKQHINNIINILFDYVLEIQAMPSGWSEQARLKKTHALWLDCNRDDLDFQEKRKSDQWQQEICQDFGSWMNSKLKNKEMKLVQFEANKWAKLLQNRLNLFDKGWEKAQ